MDSSDAAYPSPSTISSRHPSGCPSSPDRSSARSPNRISDSTSRKFLQYGVSDEFQAMVRYRGSSDADSISPESSISSRPSSQDSLSCNDDFCHTPSSISSYTGSFQGVSYDPHDLGFVPKPSSHQSSKSFASSSTASEVDVNDYPKDVMAVYLAQLMEVCGEEPVEVAGFLSSRPQFISISCNLAVMDNDRKVQMFCAGIRRVESKVYEAVTRGQYDRQIRKAVARVNDEWDCWQQENYERRRGRGHGSRRGRGRGRGSADGGVCFD